MRHCALAPIPGRGALSGDVMSHDFVEAALMRRAGWHVWLVADLGGSFEQVPPNLLAELQRDRRWCLGNLQNLRLILEPGLQPVHRVMLATGAFAYVAAPLWLAFTLLSTLGAGPLGIAAAAHPSMWALLIAMAAMLLLPKLLGVALVFVHREAHRFGGALRLLAGATAELLLSVLYAPIRMVFHSAFVASILAGRRGGWHSPPREQADTPWREALRRHGGFAALALAWTLFVADAASVRAGWLVPMLAGLLLAPVISVLGSRVGVGRWLRARGALVVPEEIWPPEVLRHARRHLRQRDLPSARPQVPAVRCLQVASS
jgi:membrane glycosyltransferase